jgi:hypothetical protein
LLSPFPTCSTYPRLAVGFLNEILFTG